MLPNNSLYYRFLSHLSPGLDLSQAKKHKPNMVQNIKNNAK